jgi:hypothetical protein
MQDVHRFRANLLPQIEWAGAEGFVFDGDGDRWFTGYYSGAFHQIASRSSLEGEAMSDLFSNLIFSQMEALMGTDDAQRRFQMMIEFQPFDPAMPTYMQKGFKDGEEVVAQLALGKAPQKLQEFFQTASEVNQIEPAADDDDIIEKSLGMTASAVEMQVKLASVYKENSGGELASGQLPLDEYCMAYVVSFAEAVLLELDIDVNEDDFGNVMPRALHKIYGPYGSDLEKMGDKAVELFLETEESKLSVRGQQEGGQDAHDISWKVGADSIPGSLASYLSEG